MLWVLDLDGVIWLAGNPIPGSPEAVRRLHDAGEQMVRSSPTTQVRPFPSTWPDWAGPVSTSTPASCSPPPRRPPRFSPRWAGGGGGRSRDQGGAHREGVAIVDVADHPDAVVVGRSVALDFAELAAAATAIRAGARFVATNNDATFPPARPRTGGGAGGGGVPGGRLRANGRSGRCGQAQSARRRPAAGPFRNSRPGGRGPAGIPTASSLSGSGRLYALVLVRRDRRQRPAGFALHPAMVEPDLVLGGDGLHLGQ